MTPAQPPDIAAAFRSAINGLRTERLLMPEEVMERLCITSRSTLAEVRKQPDFPKPVRICKAPRWREGDVDEFIRKRSAEAQSAI